MYLNRCTLDHGSHVTGLPLSEGAASSTLPVFRDYCSPACHSWSCHMDRLVVSYLV